MPLVSASVTASLATFATHVIGTLGYGGVALLTFTTGIIALPGTEPTMLFAGFDAFRGTLSLPAVIIFGVIGDMLGTSVAFAIGYYASEEWLQRHGGKLHLSARRLERAQRWFDRFGSPAIFISRFIPVVRSAFPYAAGVSEVPYRRFAPLALLGSVGWITALAVLGREVGKSWPNWRHHLDYVDYVGLALVVLAIAYLIVRLVRGRGAQTGPTVDAVSD